MTPFYSFDAVLVKLKQYEAEINADIEKLASGSKLVPCNLIVVILNVFAT